MCPLRSGEYVLEKRCRAAVDVAPQSQIALRLICATWQSAAVGRPESATRAKRSAGRAPSGCSDGTLTERIVVANQRREQSERWHAPWGCSDGTVTERIVIANQRRERSERWQAVGVGPHGKLINVTNRACVSSYQDDVHVNAREE
jgi:hypothetical protein